MTPVEKVFETYVKALLDKQKEIVDAIRKLGINYDKCDEFNQRVAKNHYALNENDFQEEKELLNEFKKSLSIVEQLIIEIKENPLVSGENPQEFSENIDN